MGLYYGTWPWLRAYVNVNRLGRSAIKIWAHIAMGIVSTFRIHVTGASWCAAAYQPPQRAFVGHMNPDAALLPRFIDDFDGIHHRVIRNGNEAQDEFPLRVRF